MSEYLKIELAEIEASQDYKDGKEEAVGRAQEIYKELYLGGGEQGLTPLQKTMKEALEGKWLPDDERRSVAQDPDQHQEIRNPDGSKFSWGQEVKPEDSIDQNPDAYKIEPESITTRQDEIDALETDQDIKDFMAKEGVDLDDVDLANMDRLAALGTKLGFTDDQIRAAFGSVVRSEIYGQAFTNEEGAKYLVDKMCRGDVKLARSILDRAQAVLGEMDSQTRAYLEDTGLGNHPDVIVALSGFYTDGLGSSVDEPGAVSFDYSEED